MSGIEETAFRIRLGRIYAPDGSKKFTSLAGQIRRRANQVGRGRGRSTGHGKTATSYFSRRVIVKVNLVKVQGRDVKLIRHHLDYIQRESAAPDKDLKEDAPEHGQGGLFNAETDRADGEAFEGRTQDDRHQFRIIVSPEDSRQLADMRAFARDVMRQMENDLGTKLDWVAVNHYDTATPHTHIVLRGVKENGHNLIIPRAYISYGMREQAERLVTIELGPMNVREAGIKLAKQVTQERFTGLDRSLYKMAADNVVDLTERPPRGTEWTRRLDIARLKHLSRLGLAEKLPGSKWKLSKTWDRTLRDLGERGDIIKARHKAIKRAGLGKDAASWGNIKYQDEMGCVTGRVLAAGVLDDVNDRAYVVIDTMNGEQLYVDVGKSQNIDGIAKDNIIEITPTTPQAKQADNVIAGIAARNGGLYSAELHAKDDPSARPDYIQAHIRRLEAMRRAGFATRYKDGSWQIPKDHMDKAVQFEAKRFQYNRVRLQILSRLGLQDMATIMGKTWLDTEMQSGRNYPDAKGFGQSVIDAQTTRRQNLVKQSILTKENAKVTGQHLDELERRDLENASKKLTREIGKLYEQRPEFGRVSGKYTKTIETVSGKYAILERSHEFTLVPWRETLEQQRGKSISANIRGQSINWQFGKQRGLGIS